MTHRVQTVTRGSGRGGFLRVGDDGAAPGALRLYSANIGDCLKVTVNSLSAISLRA